MANSYVQYTGNGVNYAVPFQYLSKAHVSVKVDGVAVPYTWTSANMVQLSSDPATGLVEIRRTTPNATRLVDFTDGSVLAADDLDNSAAQFLFLSQEAQDVASLAIIPSGDGQWDVQGRRVENASDPIDAQDLVTVAWARTALDSQLAQATAQANAAGGSATSAAASASAASGSQSAAAGSQAAAKTSADNASGSASAASGSATTATQQASAASASAAAAKTSETNAHTSETNAGNSASAAAGSANSASTSLGQALQAVTDARAQADASSASAGRAATSEGNAATYAAQAQQSATNAATGGYTKNEVDTKLLTKADAQTTYSKTQVDTMVGAKADASTTYTKTQVDTALGGKFSQLGGQLGGKLSLNQMDTGTIQQLTGSGQAALQVSSKGTTSSDVAAIEFLLAGRGGCYFGVDWDFTLKVGGGAFGGASYRLFHQGNLNPVQGIRLTFAGDMTGPNIEGVSMNNSGGARPGDMVEPYAGAVVTGAAGRNDLWDLLYGLRWRYLQVQDQNGNWNTVGFVG